ncbi:fructosamine kinase family protein [Psychrobacter jeotgali]|uniref:fructosamine kinase family protein n=1 Tax=Psychrobacter jeotgali TaxID=179010 RepID=UPI00191A202B|nr:fructosamine kinase family protein [Psychrobacter jeotgali]
MADSTSTHSDNTYDNTIPRFDSLLKAVNALSNRSISSLDDVDLQPVSGGDINEASLLTIGDSNQQVFLKQNTIEKAPVLEAEVEGLTAIRATGARTCQPLAFGIDNERGRSFLLLSVIHAFKGSNAHAQEGWHDLASQLATLHQAQPPQPPQPDNPDNFDNNQHSKWYAGWFDDNFIGSSPQRNSWTANWHEFFASQRLGAQSQMAFDNQRINRQTLQQIERIQHKLEQLLPNYPLTDEAGQPRPSLLHGDLWAGNAMLGQSADNSEDKALGYLIDPAVYVGHPETDLALTQLFGGFTSEFYDAYLEHGLVQDGFTERVDIYNLYHYLNHLNLFGSGYLNAVQRIAQRFGS